MFSGMDFDPLFNIQGTLEATIADKDVEELVDVRRRIAHDLRDLLDEMFARHREGSSPDLWDGFIDRVNAFIAREDIEQTAIEVERLRARAVASVSHVEDIAGGEAVGELSRHFSDFAESELKGANRFRAAAITFTVGAAALAAGFLWGLDDPSVAQVLQKGLVTLPILLLAGYLAREAAAHRTTYRSLKTAEVQLRTVRAFCDPLSSQTKDSIEESFGRYIFGSGPITDGSSGSESRLDDLAVVREIAALFGGGQGKGGPARADES